MLSFLDQKAAFRPLSQTASEAVFPQGLAAALWAWCQPHSQPRPAGLRGPPSVQLPLFCGPSGPGSPRFPRTLCSHQLAGASVKGPGLAWLPDVPSFHVCSGVATSAAVLASGSGRPGGAHPPGLTTTGTLTTPRHLWVLYREARPCRGASGTASRPRSAVGRSPAGLELPEPQDPPDLPALSCQCQAEAAEDGHDFRGARFLLV